MRPLFFAAARPMNVEWKMRPYLGVLPRVLSARKSAFSAPRICTVDAGYLARLVKLPACEMRRAATCATTARSGMVRDVRYGADSPGARVRRAVRWMCTRTRQKRRPGRR
eukprot:5257855-Prymnesium_polylepis.1